MCNNVYTFEFPFAQQDQQHCWQKLFQVVIFPTGAVIGFPSSTHSLAPREVLSKQTNTRPGQRKLTGKAEINTNPDINTHTLHFNSFNIFKVEYRESGQGLHTSL